jgi:hypothetical protein
MVFGVSPAPAALAPVTGSAPEGTTVIALASGGGATAVRAKPRFRIVPPGRTTTLHLRDRRGRYAGPVVVRRRGDRVIVGIRAGARLGSLTVKRGWSRPARRLGVAFIDARRSARATGGVPVGARSMGLVRSAVQGRAGPGRDHDEDGVPGAFDLDDDGDLVLDNVDANTALARASQNGAGDDPFTLLNVALAQSYVAEGFGATGVAGYALNDYAASPNGGGMADFALRQRGLLLFPLGAGEAAELDCGAAPGLTYCAPGGTGTLPEGPGGPPPFPAPGDSNGFGAMTPVGAWVPQRDGVGSTVGLDPARTFALHHGAPAAALRPGDTYVERGDGGAMRTVALHYAFQSVPAVAAWSVGTGPVVAVRYPVPRAIGQAVAEVGAAGDVVLNLAVWPPQRPPIAGSAEDGRQDIGLLTYSVAGFDGANRPWGCPVSSYATADPGLAPSPGGVADQVPDRPVSDAAAARTSAVLRVFSVNLSACLRASGLGDLGQDQAIVNVTARSAFGDAAEGGGFAFRRSSFSGTWAFPGGAAGAEVDFEFTPHSFSTSAFGIKVPRGNTVTGGTPPPGWTCAPSTSLEANDTYRCEGATAPPGEPVTGRLTLGSPGSDGMDVDLITRRAADDPEETGFRLTPR